MLFQLADLHAQRLYREHRDHDCRGIRQSGFPQAFFSADDFLFTAGNCLPGQFDLRIQCLEIVQLLSGIEREFRRELRQFLAQACFQVTLRQEIHRKRQPFQPLLRLPGFRQLQPAIRRVRLRRAGSFARFQRGLISASRMLQLAWRISARGQAILQLAFRLFQVQPAARFLEDAAREIFPGFIEHEQLMLGQHIAAAEGGISQERKAAPDRSPLRYVTRRHWPSR